MAAITSEKMRDYLSKSLSSINQNKINGVLAEIEFRKYLSTLGFHDRVSSGGWIARNTDSDFSHNVIAIFPQVIEADVDYSSESSVGDIPLGLHTMCATFHQIGINSFYCSPVIKENNHPESIQWTCLQLGLPYHPGHQMLHQVFSGFKQRQRNYNFLRYKSITDGIPDEAVSEEFTKECLRVSISNGVLSEISDIDGILWGERYTYPLEIKEKTAASDKRLGEYFGLDVGPFVKLAFYAAKKGNLHSIFIVREIDSVDTRNLVNWWYITYDKLAQYASWVPMGGGRNMQGGGSTVVRIPKEEFSSFDSDAFNCL